MPSRRAQKRGVTDRLWETIDLWVVFLLIILTGVLVFSFDSEILPTTTLLLVLLFMFFLPGYAVVAALQPRRPQKRRSVHSERYEPAIDSEGGMAIPERLVLAAGVSVGVVTANGFTLHATGVGIKPEPAYGVLAVITLIGSIIAAVRRHRLDPGSRFDGRDVLRASASVRQLFVRKSTVDLAITALIVISVVVAIAGTVFISFSVDGQESYTELYVLSPNETGEPVAAEYPSGEDGSEELLIEVANQERQKMTYTLVVQHQRFDGGTVSQSNERARVRIDLPADSKWNTTYQVPVEDDLEERRLVFLLYADSPPNDPTPENAYRAVHVWFNDSNDAT